MLTTVLTIPPPTPKINRPGRVFAIIPQFGHSPFAKKKPLFAKGLNASVFLSVFGFPRIGRGVVGKPRQIIHAGIQRQSDLSALLKGIVALAAFDLGIVALIDAGQHLHLDLRDSSLFSQLSQP